MRESASDLFPSHRVPFAPPLPFPSLEPPSNFVSLQPHGALSTFFSTTTTSNFFTMVAAAHHGVINSGSKKAVLAVLLSFSSFFLLFAILSLPWTSVLLSRGGWRKGWWLSGQSSSSSSSSIRGKRRSLDTPRSLIVEDKIGEGIESERAWSPPPLVTSRPLRRIPIPPGIPVHSRNIPWLNLSVLQVRLIDSRRRSFSFDLVS